jgi:hypothetical protein
MPKNIFIEKKIYVVDEDAVYFAIKDLSYSEFMDFQSQYFEEAISKNIIANTEDAKKSHWKRLMESLKIKFNFKKPSSTSTSALKKQMQRGN